jgi:preprotein translocase SecE subunit
LRKSTWPTRDELKQHITVVLISSLLLATFTFVADNLLREIVWGALMNSETYLFGGSGQ